MATKKTAAKKSTVKKVAAKKTAAKKTAVKRAGSPARVVATPSSSPDVKQLAHGLHALLHTMQNVERYEERLCSMMHALERGKRPNTALLRDLRATLQALPVEDYRDDVQDLLDALS